jgi:hypothetical protein
MKRHHLICRLSAASMVSFVAMMPCLSFAALEQIDVTDHLTSVLCQMPSDDQSGSAQLVIGPSHGHRSLAFELRFLSGAHSKLISLPIELVQFDQVEKAYLFELQASGSNENSARIDQDGQGEIKIQETGLHFKYSLTNCRIELDQSTSRSTLGDD